MGKLLKTALSLLLISIVFLAMGVPAAQATVEDGWPAGQPNTPRNADDFFIDFEDGIEAIEIESTIPSLQFTTTSGIDWRYSDIRTGNYNAYPYGTQAYEINGNFGAWLGETGDAGRIDFIGGGATYCSLLASTASGLTIDAYNREDELIANSGWADSNVNTRTFTRLTVEAPWDETISYVIIHDTGNYWVIDDLCTDANRVVLPVPGRFIGFHEEKFDLVFIPDTDYGSQADIETWLPIFLDHIDQQLDQRLDGAVPVTGNLDKFNFYYTTLQGHYTEDWGTSSLPDGITKLSPFADSYVILHTNNLNDSCIMSDPSKYAAEGQITRSFVHESGHGIFGLADEYDDSNYGCPTGRFEPDPLPNVWDTREGGIADAVEEYSTPIKGEFLGIADGKKIQFGPVLNSNSLNAANPFFANTDTDSNVVDSDDVVVYLSGYKQSIDSYTISTTDGNISFFMPPLVGALVTVDYSYVKDEDWNPIQIYEFTPCKGGWCKLGNTPYIMKDGNYFNNGWGEPAARRIQWFLDEYPFIDINGGASSEAEKSIWLNLEVSSGVFSLLDESYLTGAPPEYLPGEHDFVAKIFSTSGDLLGGYGFNDPRKIQGESGYNGPTWQDEVRFQLVLPYFYNGGRIDLIESETGIVKLSIDISQYATQFGDITSPTVVMLSPPSGSALQDGVTFIASVIDDESGVEYVAFSIREDDGGNGIPIGFEDIAACYDGDTGIATLPFDTLQLLDGNYLVVISATDSDGNCGSITVPYSVNNWDFVEQLPATPKNQAGRTIPIKFSINVASSVNPEQPFVYNENLTIKIFATSNSDILMQTSKFGSKAQDYRIETNGDYFTSLENDAHYITNFKTSRQPMQYRVEIWRNDNNFQVGYFTFETVR